MSKNTSISLGKHFENFINKNIQEGRYKNASEIVRAGLRLLEEQEQKITALKIAIEEGERSGIIENYDPIKHLENLRTRNS